jgi:hypothetical protein
MSKDGRNQLRSAVAAAQARVDERKERERQLAQRHAELVQRATEAAGPLIDVLEAFLEAMARHGNPGLQEVTLTKYVSTDSEGSPRYERAPAGKQGWNLGGVEVCPDGTGVGGVPALFGDSTRVVSLHEAARDCLVATPEWRWKTSTADVIATAGAILHQHGIKL